MQPDTLLDFHGWIKWSMHSNLIILWSKIFYLWGQFRVSRLASRYDCPLHALREINSRGRLGGTVVKPSDLQSATRSSIPGRRRFELFLNFFSLFFFFFISKSNDLSTEIRKVIAYLINIRTVCQIVSSHLPACKLHQLTLWIVLNRWDQSKHCACFSLFLIITRHE